MSQDKSSSKQDDLKINDLPKKDGGAIDDTKVKGGLPPRGGGPHMTYTGDEVDTQTGD